MEKKLILFASDPERTEKNFKLAEKAVVLLETDNVEMIPLVNIEQDRMKFYYSAADLLLLTSIYEGSPNVIKEAMACNCPIVSTDVGDVRSVIKGTDGCYLSSYDEHEMARLIAYTLKFASDGKRTSGRERIIKLGLDSESIAKKIEEVYRKVIGGNPERWNNSD